MADSECSLGQKISYQTVTAMAMAADEKSRLEDLSYLQETKTLKTLLLESLKEMQE